MTSISRTLFASTAIALSLGLTACGGSEETEETTAGASPAQDAGASASPEQEAESTAEADAASAQALIWEEGWVRATDEGMTGTFGSLHNTTDEDIHLTGAESAIAGLTELHETVEDNSGSTMMQEKEHGFVIPAGSTLELEPGGDHVMLMDLQEEIAPGDEVTVVLQTDAGDYESVVVAKEYAGAQEEYVQDHGGGGEHGGEGEQEH